ncbi:MAG: hypothetical protein AB9907_02615 [Flexilinea sp.]
MNSSKTATTGTLIGRMVIKMPMGMCMCISMICVYMQRGLSFKSGYG